MRKDNKNEEVNPLTFKQIKHEDGSVYWGQTVQAVPCEDVVQDVGVVLTGFQKDTVSD